MPRVILPPIRFWTGRRPRCCQRGMGDQATGVKGQAIGGNVVVNRGVSSGGNGQDSSKGVMLPPIRFWTGRRSRCCWRGVGERAAGVKGQAIGGNAVVDRGTSSGGNGQDSSKEEWGGSRKGKWAAMQWEAMSTLMAQKGVGVGGTGHPWRQWWRQTLDPSAKTRPRSISIVLFKIVNRNIYFIKNGLYIDFRLILWP